MVIELRSFCTTGGGSSAVTSTKSMFALNRPALPCNALLPGPQTLRTSTQQRKPSDPNTLPSESCQCCSHALPCHASICTYWPRTIYDMYVMGKLWQTRPYCDPPLTVIVTLQLLLRVSTLRLWECECACGLRNVSNTTQPGFDPTASTRKEQQVAKSKNWLARQFHFPGCLQTVCW